MICYVLAMGKQHLGLHVVVGYGIKIFWPGLFITSPDHLDTMAFLYLRLKMSVPIAKTNYVFDCCIVPLILTCQQNITNGN